MDDLGIASLVVTSLKNIEWLTGFAGSAGAVLVRPDDVVLVTDSRYDQEAGELAGAAVGLISLMRVSHTYDETLASAIAAERP